MERYEIRCTEEQTRMARALGAPIETANNRFNEELSPIGDGLYAIIPTAEEMIGWLEGQKVYIEITYTGIYNWKVANGTGGFINGSFGGHDSREEATLKAIDKALEHLCILNVFY